MASMPFKIGSQQKQKAIKGCKKSSSGQMIVPDNVIVIAEDAFRDCIHITSIVVPPNVTEISPDAFTGCTSLESIEVDPDNRIYFSQDGILYGSNIINEWGNEVKQYLLFCPTTKTEAHIHSNTRFIRNRPFAECRSLTSVTLPSLSAVPEDLFDDCISLKNVDISQLTYPVNIERLFVRCQSLEHITFSDAQNVIEQNELILSSDKSRLILCLATVRNVIIPETVREISKNVFIQFNRCESVEVEESSPYFIMNDGILYNHNITKMIWCPPDKTVIHLPDTVTELPVPNLKSLSNLTAVEISENNKTFSSVNGAVFSKSQTKTVLIPARLSQMTLPPMFYTQVFDNCRHIGSIEVACDAVNHIVKDGVLYFHYEEDDTLDMIVCSSAADNITIPANVTMISEGGRLPGAFAVAESLNEIAVEYGNSSFFARDGVLYTRGEMQRLIACPRTKTEIAVPRFIKILANEAFMYNEMKSITIPKGIQIIGHKCFAHCHNLEEVILAQTLTFIGNQAFADCPNLKTVVFPNQPIEYCADSFDDGITFIGRHKNCIIHPADEWSDI